MTTLKEYDLVTVTFPQKMECRWGMLDRIKETPKGTLYTVAYSDGERLFYRSYYANNPNVRIERDTEIV